MNRKPHVAVVGAGIVGSAIGLELAARGASVTLVDAGGVRASEISFGWINASWFNRPDYFHLRYYSMAAWQRWDKRVPGLNPCWTGCLLWDLEADALEAYLRDYGTMGYELESVEREKIRRIEPGLAKPPARAVLATEEGFVEGGDAVRVIRAAALAAGARLIEGTATAVEEDGVRLADGQRIDADRIVVAAGIGTRDLLGLPVDDVLGLMILTMPTRTRIAHVLTPPGLNLRQAADGGLLCAGGPGGSAVDGELQKITYALLAQVRVLIGEPGLELQRIIIGHRPTPTDGHPIIGPVPGRAGVYVAVMHSGVTLAPGVAELVADEVLNGSQASLLAPFRADRFRESMSIG
jgi:glycine/D-amino acid oxidase-like deaminating enzyme